MQNYYVTFRKGQLEDYDVDPANLILVLRGQTSYKAMLNHFGLGFTDKFESICSYECFDKYYRGRGDIKVYYPKELEKRRKENAM